MFGESLMMRAYNDPALRHDPIDDDTLSAMAVVAAARLGELVERERERERGGEGEIGR